MDVVKIEGKNGTPFSFPWNRSIDLSGKVIVSFGGAGGLSELFQYAATICGARVVIVDWSPADKEKRTQLLEHVKTMARNVTDLSGRETPLVLFADVTSMDDTLAVASEVKSRHGRIDVAIDFAGTHHPVFDLVKDDPKGLAARFRSVIELNLNGAFVFTVAMARAMVPQRSGHIIHLCSSGSRDSLYGSYAYNASKHGLEGLVKTAAAQLAHFGVRVNAIAPGTVVTDLNRSLSFTPEGKYRARAKSILAHTPTKRFATREGFAETLLAMCVEQRHLTGNLVFPDDGYTVEGHSWPEGNEALYDSPEALDRLYARLDRDYPREL